MARERRVRLAVLEMLTALALLALIAVVRTYQLGADPPTGLSISSDVETDPPQYTLFARNHALFDDFDPFDDVRRTVFLKSSMTVVAEAVFGVIGTGSWQSCVPGLMYAIGAIMLFWLFVRRIGGAAAGLIFLLLAALDYNLIFFGRLSFLEHAMTFWAFLALVIVAYARRAVWMLPAGLALGVGIFFGKALGVVFFFPFACWFGYKMLFERADRRGWLVRAGLFAAGVLIVLAAWHQLVYAPSQTQVAGYYSEQAVDLYGAPKGLQSFAGFWTQFATFGDATHLFPRMITSALLAVGFLLVALHGATVRGGWRTISARVSAGHCFLTAMIVAWYGSLMIWNYRPLRYQLVLIYALHAAAAVMLVRMWEWGRQARRGDNERARWYLFIPVAAVILLPAVYQLWQGAGGALGRVVTFEHDWFGPALFSAAAAAGFWWWSKLRPTPQPGGGRFVLRAAVVLVLGAATFEGFADYHYWTRRPTFTARDNSRDLAMTVGPRAVLSGPYAPLLAAENHHEVVVHMFGVAEADTLLFSRFPITHLLLDEANENQARADYPEVMGAAEHVVTYTIGVDKVRLFRVAGSTGNARADAYEPTLLEQAVDAYHAADIGRGHALAADYILKYPKNLMGYYTVGEVADLSGQFDLAVESLKGAAAYSPRNYNVQARLAECYRKEYERTGDEALRRTALEYYEAAIHLAPTVEKLRQTYENLKYGARAPSAIMAPHLDSAGNRVVRPGEN